jgi:putative CocE/NonD family hydrolase
VKFRRLGLLAISSGAILLHGATLSEAKYKVKVLPDVRIRMRDGVELAARITRPDVEGKFPAIMSYNPYRRLSTMKMAYSEARFEHNLHASSYFAERGYVMVDYDVRGTGNSGGSSQEMYSDDERRDGYDMVEWIAAQPWCTGNVGMWGMSYGGVDTWQVAVQHPPHLKAVIVRSGTEDVYNDWTYPGGSPRSLFIFGNYAPQMVADNFAPPDPELTGEKWAEIWEEHLQHNVPWSIGFLKHQVDDKYWALRSVWPDYDRIKCPVFVIEGWADWYQTAELRAFSRLKVPKRAWIGPWAHYWPENAFPGPRIDGRREYLKWFDHWLKGINNGVMDEPPVTLFIRQYQAPAPMYMEDKGFWRSEREWPPARSNATAMYLASGGRLTRETGERSEEARDSFSYYPAVGVMSGILARGNVAPWAMPLDQRLDEAYSLTYTTPPLEADMEVTGDPSAELFVSSSADVTYFEVKLCDVAPDGVSKMVSDGGLNATRRLSRSKPEPLKPGEVYELKINLKSMAYVFPAGHRIRVDVASSDFQNVWPASKQAVNTIYRTGKFPSRVILPILPPQNPKLPLPDLQPSPNPQPEPDAVAKPQYTVTYDLVNETTTLTTANPAGRTSYTISSKNPGEAVMKATRELVVSKPDSEIKVEAQCVTSSDTKVFRHLVEVEVLVDGKRHFQKSWSVVAPRDLN